MGIESKISVQESKPIAVLFRHSLSVNIENHLAIRMRWLACKCMTGSHSITPPSSTYPPLQTSLVQPG
jgi:hypothetical protein